MLHAISSVPDLTEEEIVQALAAAMQVSGKAEDPDVLGFLRALAPAKFNRARLRLALTHALQTDEIKIQLILCLRHALRSNVVLTAANPKVSR